MTESAKVLVTGASGYIAGHVVKLLQEAGHQVRGTVRSVKNTDKVKHLYDLCPNAAHKLQLVEADLLDAESWPPAVEDMSYVIHVASPLPNKAVKNEDELIKPAVEGTLNVLRACAKSGTVRRVVFTSAGVVMAHGSGAGDGARAEEGWEDLKNLEGHAYAKSKWLAERAAWDFMKELPEEEKFELSVIIPVGVLGPPLNNTPAASLEVVRRLLDRQIPAIPRFNMPIIDVRDLAQAHVKAMTVPKAAGDRFLCRADNLWMSEIAALLRSVFEPQGYSIPSRMCPDFLLRLASWFTQDPGLKFITPHLGIVSRLDNSKMRELLGVEPRNVRDTVIDTAYSLTEKGLVRKTTSYRGPGGAEERQRYLELKL